ncbi:PREDICTED: uncharacterized protein LOC106818994 [Priapulus caudatus]|uniref:Uncharacterized protein LOC106818994 n=1 Tax=Priapulus caudatus TaxID=37621 RepID=A0ABM1F3X3_PRICU|nr:PREDICTED: uncharacterized protein LOC106818994 [Priapulus caudatus]
MEISKLMVTGGTMGVHFDCRDLTCIKPEILKNVMNFAIRIYVRAFDKFYNDMRAKHGNISLVSDLEQACVTGSKMDVKPWKLGPIFYEYLRREEYASLPTNKVGFDISGHNKYSRLEIINLQERFDKSKRAYIRVWRKSRDYKVIVPDMQA